jgi:tRNA (guanosine-2'-O-)-methyltransferase
MKDVNYREQLINYLESFVTERRLERLKEVLAERTNHLTVVLEDVYQTHNFSAVLRSADIFGVQNVHFIENRNTYKISEDVSMGSTQWLSIHRYQKGENNTNSCLQNLKQKGYKIVATSLHKNSVSLQELDIKQPIALVFGTELTGISKDVEEMADEFVKLPMYGFTESFNISVCAALCMYDLTGRIRREIPNYHISKEGQKDIYIDWLKTCVKKPDLLIKEFENKYTLKP